MEMTYKHRTEQASPEKSARVPERAALGGGVPNSAMLSMLGAPPDDNHGRNTDALAAAVMGRLPQMRGRPQAQLPQAEQEADRLSAAVTSGSPDAVKAAMGAKLEADLSGVRFHTDAASAARADAMGARAFTAGADVYFGREGFDPAVAAHELVHTVQQGAVAGGTETVSAPLGGVQMWLGNVKFGKRSRILKGEDQNTAKVAQYPTTGLGSSDAAVKMDVDPEMERAANAFYGAAAELYSKRKGAWSFDSMQYRPLSKKERKDAKDRLLSGDFQLTAPLSTDAQQRDQELENELDRMGVYPMAKGKRMQESEVSEIMAGRDNRDDYQRMMGYVAMMDLAGGNTDRLVGNFNAKNFIEDEGAGKVHLIDNDLNGGLPLDGISLADQQALWLNNLVANTSIGFGGRALPSSQWSTKNVAGQIIGNLPEMRDGDLGQLVLGSEHGQAGMEQAVEDLPEMEKRLRKSFGKNPSQVQQMLLERLKVTREYMTNPQMAAIYRQLGERPKSGGHPLGLAPSPNEPGNVTQQRQGLLDQLEQLRQNQEQPKKKHRTPWQWLKDKFSRKKS